MSEAKKDESDLSALLCCEKDSSIMATCPKCGGPHFNIIKNGEAQCASMSVLNNEIGCGWRGEIKT